MIQFGWYNSYRILAEKGVFNLPNETPITSAKKAPLYEALTYLSVLKAEELDAS